MRKNTRILRLAQAKRHRCVFYLDLRAPKYTRWPPRPHQMKKVCIFGFSFNAAALAHPSAQISPSSCCVLCLLCFSPHVAAWLRKRQCFAPVGLGPSAFPKILCQIRLESPFHPYCDHSAQRAFSSRPARFSLRHFSHCDGAWPTRVFFRVAWSHDPLRVSYSSVAARPRDCLPCTPQPLRPETSPVHPAATPLF